MYHKKSVLKYFNENEQKQIKKHTNNLHFWSWFNNIPIYKNDYLINFFKYLDINKENFIKFMTNYNSNFEYIMYEYYLILNCNFKMKFLKTPLFYESIIERADLYNTEIINEIDTYWYPKRAYDINYTKINNENIFILFHLDR